MPVAGSLRQTFDLLAAENYKEERVIEVVRETVNCLSRGPAPLPPLAAGAPALAGPYIVLPRNSDHNLPPCPKFKEIG